jgi:hypothetical protein
MALDDITCPACGAAQARDSRFCMVCGRNLLGSNAANAPTVIDGRYEVLEKLGEGSFGPAYLVRDVQLNRRVVLKARRDPDPEMARMLHREAAALGGIAPPTLLPF